MKKLEDLFPLHQIVKHFSVGVSGYIINISVVFALVELVGAHYLLSAFFAYIIAISNNFLWNKRWTFCDKCVDYKTQYSKYFVVSLMSLVFNLAILTLLVEVFGLWYLFAQTIAILIVGINTFLWNKFWVFRKKLK